MGVAVSYEPGTPVQCGLSLTNKGHSLNCRARPQWGNFRSNTEDFLAHPKTCETCTLPQGCLIRSRPLGPLGSSSSQ